MIEPKEGMKVVLRVPLAPQAWAGHHDAEWMRAMRAMDGKVMTIRADSLGRVGEMRNGVRCVTVDEAMSRIPLAWLDAVAPSEQVAAEEAASLRELIAALTGERDRFERELRAAHANTQEMEALAISRKKELDAEHARRLEWEVTVVGNAWAETERLQAEMKPLLIHKGDCIHARLERRAKEVRASFERGREAGARARAAVGRVLRLPWAWLKNSIDPDRPVSLLSAALGAVAMMALTGGVARENGVLRDRNAVLMDKLERCIPCERKHVYALDFADGARETVAPILTLTKTSKRAWH